MNNLDQFYTGIITNDNRLRTQTYSNLKEYLRNPTTSLKCDDTAQLVDGLAAWVNSSNFKVSHCGLEVLCLLVNRMGESFRPYVVNVLESTVNRLGDMHDEVRETAQDLLLKLMSPASSPSFVFERIWPTASIHKQFRVREQICICLANLLNHYGAKSIQLNKIVAQLVKLMDDSNTQVREASMLALTEVYRHVGERVRVDVTKQGLSQSKLNQLFSRFDEVRESGDMVATANSTKPSAAATPRRPSQNDDVDFARPAPPNEIRSMGPPKSKSSVVGRKASSASTSGKSGGAGALSEDFFINSFYQVPKVNIHSHRDMEDRLQNSYKILSNTDSDWEKKVHELKIVRSIVIEGGANYDEFYTSLRQFETAFIFAVKDLRSQVVREACITIAFYAQNLEGRLEHFSEALLPSLINLIPNSAKVMATSGSTALKFIVQSVHSHRLIPIILSQAASKSNVIRRYCYQLIEQVLGLWHSSVMERYTSTFQDVIKRGVSDADADARNYARKAFWLFSQHFKPEADRLYDQLDGNRQKQLQDEVSRSSSSNSINSQSDHAVHARVGASNRSHSTDRTQPESNFRRDGIRRSARGTSSNKSNLSARPRKGSGLAVPSTSDSGLINGSAKKRVSHSQPGSRSNSPSSRLFGSTTSAGRPRKKSGIPRSQGTSRESSPGRNNIYSAHPARRVSGSSVPRLLDGSSDTADLLAQKLSGNASFSRRRYDSYGNAASDDDAGSETSSLASESLSTFAGSTRVTDDVNNIIHNLSSGQWSERKEGLLQLQYFLVHIRSLTPQELRRITEIFTRMFHDPHAKVFSIFMDTLIEVLSIHKHMLHDWLYILITRMLTKCGGEMLASVAAKAQRTLDTIMETFDNVSQFIALMKFLGDQSSSINFKVKLVYLNYVHSLLQQMEMSELINNNDSRSAISKIITWISEPKSADVRKASTAVVVAMFNLNPPEFSALINNLQKSFQDTAHRVVATHMQGVVDTETLRNPLMSTPARGSSPRQHREQHRASPRSRLASAAGVNSGGASTSAARRQEPTQPLDPADIFQSIRQTTAAIQNLSLNSNKLDTVDSLNKERDSTSQDSGIQRSCNDVRIESPRDSSKTPYKPSRYATPLTETTGLLLNGADFQTPPLNIDSDPDDSPLDNPDPLAKILQELSNHDTRHEQRQAVMEELIDMARVGYPSSIWDEHFKTLLLLLLETLGDKEANVRTQALRVLREIVKTEKERFDHYAELTILKVIESHEDESKEVVRAAEECAMTMAQNIRPEHSVVVLSKLTDTFNYPLSMAAIKMLNKVIERLDSSSVKAVLHRVVTGLLKGFSDNNSDCRKASVFTLVSVYMKVGEDLRPYLSELNSSKTKLLNLYIQKAKDKSSS